MLKSPEKKCNVLDFFFFTFFFILHLHFFYITFCLCPWIQWLFVCSGHIRDYLKNNRKLQVDSKYTLRIHNLINQIWANKIKLLILQHDDILNKAFSFEVMVVGSTLFARTLEVANRVGCNLWLYVNHYCLSFLFTLKYGAAQKKRKEKYPRYRSNCPRMYRCCHVNCISSQTPHWTHIFPPYIRMLGKLKLDTVLW